MITANRLKEVLHYDPDTGVFTWIADTNSRVYIGKVAGCHTPGGYTLIGIDGRTYRAHRLAWLYHYGTSPQSGKVIDHSNQIKSDNRICNLRLADKDSNMWNSKMGSRNTSGVKGVRWDSQRRGWNARLHFKSKCVFCQHYPTLEDAAAGRREAELKYYGKFAPA